MHFKNIRKGCVSCICVLETAEHYSASIHLYWSSNSESCWSSCMEEKGSAKVTVTVSVVWIYSVWRQAPTYCKTIVILPVTCILNNTFRGPTLSGMNDYHANYEVVKVKCLYVSSQNFSNGNLHIGFSNVLCSQEVKILYRPAVCLRQFLSFRTDHPDSLAGTVQFVFDGLAMYVLWFKDREPSVRWKQLMELATVCSRVLFCWYSVLWLLIQTIWLQNRDCNFFESLMKGKPIFTSECFGKEKVL